MTVYMENIIVNIVKYAWKWHYDLNSPHAHAHHTNIISTRADMTFEGNTIFIQSLLVI